MTQKEWILKMATFAQNAQKRFGYLASVLIAQSCLENGYGMDASCDVLTQANNVLGMKRELLNSTWASDYWHGSFITKETPEWNAGGRYFKTDSFRKYSSLQDCFFDYCQFMRDARYSKGGSYKYREVLSITDPKTLITTVAGRGYCTDPDYPANIMKIIQKHDLTRYDKIGSVFNTVTSILACFNRVLVDLIAENRDQVPAHDANEHRYLAIHYLGVSNADNPFLYGGGFGAHFYVPGDGRKAYQSALVTDKLWHVGASAENGYSYIHEDARNSNTIGLEIGTFLDSQGRWMFTEEAQEMAAELAAAVMLVYGIPIGNLLRHGDITTKCCPAPLMPVSRGGYENTGSNWSWEKFKDRVTELMETIPDLSGFVLSRGSRGESVRKLQKDLIRLGYSCGSAGADGDYEGDTHIAVQVFQKEANLTVDGIAGPATRKTLAVMVVQKWLNNLRGSGLTIDGRCGPNTRYVLVSTLQKCLAEIYLCRIDIDGSFGPETKKACVTVGKSGSGLLVSILQAGLLVNGVMCSGIDASFGGATERGVKAFQVMAGIEIDGIAGPQTFEKLFV